MVRLLPLTGFVPLVAGAANLCALVDSRLPGLISYPGSAVYTASQEYYAAEERDLTPNCVFRPNSTSDVSQFVKLVSKNGSRDAAGNYLPIFAIRGGGHTLWTGAANIDGGITVDMRGINSLVLSPDLKTASVGAGALWGNLYPDLVPHNLTVMGGRIPSIGVGGFATGGGMTFLARRHGWTCDNIYGYEVVLASGEVVYASASSHQDLWLALKGGSNNFGIVTRFDIATFPMGLMWGGVLSFNYSQSVLDAQAKGFSNFMKPKNFDSAAMMGVDIGFRKGAFSASNVLFYVEPVANPLVYNAFLSIPSIANTLALNNVASMVDTFGKFLPPNLNRAIEYSFTFKSGDAALYSQLFKSVESIVPTMANISGFTFQYLIQPNPVTNGTNSLGLTPNQTDLVNVDITAAYNNAADDAFVQQQVLALLNNQTQFLSKKGLLIPFKYLNYADVSQNAIDSYGRTSKARLQAISRKYDPRGLFQTGVPGGVKLFNSNNSNY